MTNYRRSGLACCVLALSGCVTFGQFELGLKNMVGHPLSDTYPVVGYPSSKLELGDRTVYVWNTAFSATLTLPQTAQTTATAYSPKGPTTVYATTTYNKSEVLDFSCEMKMVTDQSGVIIDAHYFGNLGGCERYIKALTKYRTGK